MKSLTRRNPRRSFYPFARVRDFRRDMGSIYKGFDSFRHHDYQKLYTVKSLTQRSVIDKCTNLKKRINETSAPPR